MATSNPVRQANPTPASLKVFIAEGDANSQRMIETLKQIPSLHHVTTVVDALRNPHSGITSVPSLLVNGSKVYTGTGAFEYLRGFDSVLRDTPGDCSLEFCSLNGSEACNSSWYSAFEPCA